MSFTVFEVVHLLVAKQRMFTCNIQTFLLDCYLSEHLGDLRLQVMVH